MLDRQGFDGWASEYDEAVKRSMEAGTYPFCGYGSVQDAVFELVKDKARVLDLGIGTARLTSRLYERGAEVYGVDFSQNMLECARAKMPNATLLQADLTLGMPKELQRIKFGAITALYSIHHLTDAQKAVVINAGLKMLEPGGLFVIGDVAFQSEADREECRRIAGDAFDDAEYYCVADRLRGMVDGELTFKKLSFCAGVITIA